MCFIGSRTRGQDELCLWGNRVEDFDINLSRPPRDVNKTRDSPSAPTLTLHNGLCVYSPALHARLRARVDLLRRY